MSSPSVFDTSATRAAISALSAARAPPAPDSVTIEHLEAGAKIQITSDGTITISGKNLLFEATEKITLKATGVDIP